MSWRTAKGRAAGRHVKKIEWTETPLMRAPSAAAAAAARYRMRPYRNRRTGGLILAPGEFKSVDTVITGDLNQTGTISLINGIARGDEINERNGREITMKSVQLSMACESTATTGIAQTCRILLVYDRQANAAAPTFAQVLAATGGSCVISPRNLENRKRFKILMDRKFSLGPQGGTTTALGAPAKKVLRDYYRKLTLPVTFNSGDAGTVADIVTGSLYILTCGEVAAGATDGVASIYARVRYTDH